VDPDVAIEQIVWGCWFTEGPIWDVDRDRLLFSDVPASTRRGWSEQDDWIRIVCRPTNRTNGQTYDAEGRLVVCEHDTSCVSRMEGEGSGRGRVVLATHWEGKGLNSPNDIVVHSDGSISFTAPTSGRVAPDHGLVRPLELDFKGVFRIAPDGELQLVADDFNGPNGLCFSPGEELLYVNDTPERHIRVFDVQSDGSLANGRIFAEDIGVFDPILGPKKGGYLDGLKCDAEANIWVTGPEGMWVFGPDGEHLGGIKTPQSVGNLHWGGPDFSW